MIKRVKKFFLNKEVKKVLRYIYSAAKVTTIIGIIILLISMIMILISQKFEDFIIGTDLKYNSPILNNLTITFVVADIFVLIYGVSLCLYKYKRMNESKNSYDALKNALEEEEKRS